MRGVVQIGTTPIFCLASQRTSRQTIAKLEIVIVIGRWIDSSYKKLLSSFPAGRLLTRSRIRKVAGIYRAEVAQRNSQLVIFLPEKLFTFSSSSSSFLSSARSSLSFLLLFCLTVVVDRSSTWIAKLYSRKKPNWHSCSILYIANAKAITIQLAQIVLVRYIVVSHFCMVLYRIRSCHISWRCCKYDTHIAGNITEHTN